MAMAEIDIQINKIRQYYDSRARSFKGQSAVSMPDSFLINLENKVLRRYILKKGHLLDAGCANGYSSLEFAKSGQLKVTGVDYSEAMILDAQKLLTTNPKKLQKKVNFKVGNVLDLKEKDNHYDQVVSKRCIINLPTWELQQKALNEFIRVLRPKGALILSEASLQGWQNMNQLRKEFGLPIIPQPWHNLYLDDHKLLLHLGKKAELVAVINFSSTYYLGSRVLQPFIIGRDREPRYDSEINRLFSILPSIGDYGTQKLYLFKKHPPFIARKKKK